MQVVSFAGACARREHKRELELEVEFRRHSYAFGPLTDDSWLLQCPLGCHQVLRTLDEAQRLLSKLGSVQ